MRKHTWSAAGYVLATFALFLKVGSAHAQQTELEPRTVRSADHERAREIYRRDCLVCHGASGDGKTEILRDRDLKLPDWTDPKSLDGRGDQQLFNVIRFGRGKMPAERVGRANDEEVVDLIRYIRTIARDEAMSTPTAGTSTLKR